MFDALTGEPITKENARPTRMSSQGNEMHVRAVPQAGDLVSFGRRAWRVKQMVFVDNGAIRCMCEAIDAPSIANLSYK